LIAGERAEHEHRQIYKNNPAEFKRTRRAVLKLADPAIFAF
jgi:hypothetical protein